MDSNKSPQKLGPPFWRRHLNRLSNRKFWDSSKPQNKIVFQFCKVWIQIICFSPSWDGKFFSVLYILDSAILADVFKDHNKNFSKPKLLLKLPRDAFDELIKPSKFEDQFGWQTFWSENKFKGLPCGTCRMIAEPLQIYALQMMDPILDCNFSILKFLKLQLKVQN